MFGDRTRVEHLIKELLLEIASSNELGEEVRDNTPTRVANMYMEIFEGHRAFTEPSMSTFTSDGPSIVIQNDIHVFSMCEHHLLPMFGTVDIAFLPSELKCGLSKLSRAAKYIGRKLQVQERYNEQLADFLVDKLTHVQPYGTQGQETRTPPHGVMVVSRFQHLCMMMRGIKEPNAVTTVSTVRGVFKENIDVRMETLALLNGGKK